MATIALTHAHIVPVVGDPFDGTLVMTDGRIAALGTDIAVPDDAEVIDAAGRWVLPGFVEAHGHVGIEEESHGWAGQDINEGGAPNGSRFRAIDGVHPTDEGFRDALSGGVTAVVCKPGSANPIGGQTVALKTWGRLVDEMVFAEPCSMKSALGENPKNYNWNLQKTPPKTRLGVAATIREAFVDAQNYRAKRDAAAAKDEPFERNLGTEALVRVLDGEVPWCQHCHRVDDVATAVRLADEFGYRLIVNHGTEAHLIAGFLAERHIPVIIGPLFTSRSKQELALRSLRNPGILARAGVQIAITTDHPVVPINFLVYQAILAMKEGLDRDEALRAITINPARMLGLDTRVGSLEVGKDADVVVWDGDPLDIMSRAQQVFVAGRAVYHFDAEQGVGITLDPYQTLATRKND